MFSNSQKTNHVLNIEEYSQEDLFILFDLPVTLREIRIEHIKLAKHKVMQSHPDKSRLHPDYFRFYKKAFERLVQIYENHSKTGKAVPIVSCKDDEIQYHPLDSTVSQVNTSSLSNQEFHNIFNRLFDENMAEKIDTKKNEWFRSEQVDPAYANLSVKNSSQMHAEMERIKAQEKQRALAVYRGVVPLTLGAGSGANYLGETEEEQSEYITTDPFSKLKYEDLRKVHKDQTVFMVSEKDLEHVKKYDSVDAYKTERTHSHHQWKPVDREQGEHILLDQEHARKENMLRREQAAKRMELEYAEKNRRVMGAFLQLR
jgi:hypothetical protein